MKQLLSAVLVLFAGAIALSAQNVSDLIISEALAQPDSTSIMDDYGRHTGWVELYNKSTGTVNFGGCYLTDDRTNLRKSLIPKSDLRTKIGPRQVALIFCSGNGADGTFYADFTLAPGKTVYLVSNDGRTIIDSLVIPATLPKGLAAYKMADDIRQQNFELVDNPEIPSPRIINGNLNTATKGEQMKERDPHGWILTVVSISVVFSALAILWFMFWLLFDRRAKKLAKPAPVKKGTESDEVAAAIALALDMEAGGDDYAAIAAAVHLYLSESVHDIEPGIITIRRTNTLWNNKELTFRQLPK